MEKLKISYTLTEQELYDGLRLSGIYKSSGKRAAIETGILVVFCLLFLVSYFWKWEIFNLIMALVSLGVLLALNLVPRMDMKKQVKEAEREIRLQLSPLKIQVETKAGLKTIPLDGTSEIKLVGKPGKKLIVVRIATGGLFLLPLRALPEAEREKALSWLLEEAESLLL